MSIDLETPVCRHVVSFMAMEAAEQVRYFDEELPEYRGRPISPLSLLTNVLQTRMLDFFDYYPDAGDQSLVDSLSDAIGKVVSRDSKKDFETCREWERIRELAKTMLGNARLETTEVPMPLPLKDWVNHVAGIDLPWPPV